MGLNKEITGKIFDIQGFSVHDGPGARTLIFFKGCPLNCLWCSNPEGKSANSIPLHYDSKCIKCGNCLKSCRHKAIKLKNDKIIIDRDLCEVCTDHTCIQKCYTDAISMTGRDISVKDLYAIIQRDRQFWGNKGGITLTGGEPLMQIEFVRSLLKKSYDAYIHTAIETSGQVPWKNFEQTIDYLDWIFFDLKHIDSDEHMIGTGSNNNIILNNALKLSEFFKGRLIFRLPIIPGFNNSNENLEKMADFISKTKRKEINILPLHHLGKEKYTFLDKEYAGSKFKAPTQNELFEAQDIFKKKNINCYIGSKTPF